MVKSNAPNNYVCPICLGVNKADSPDTLMKPTDIIYKDNFVTGFINSFFVGNNPGHAIIVPNDHYENIYDLPEETGNHIFAVAQKIALAMKTTYGCDGITLRQNNEPAGDQHAFHFHLHVFPRYKNDGYNSVQPSEKRLADPKERAEYAKTLSAALVPSET
ncbi:MAG TPA: HIT family protein [Candidatus Saccharimonadales bacterium]|nr:HIT family protein [Candidatus Saccharimonadales bacterium]